MTERPWSGNKRPVEIAATAAVAGLARNNSAGASVRDNIPIGAMQLGIGADFVFWRGHDLTILEPDLAAAVSYSRPLGRAAWSVGLEAAGILHHFSGVGASGSRFDGRLGVPLGIGFEHNRVFLTVMPYTRADKLEHFVSGARIYTSEHWGVLARLGVGFGAP